MVSIAELATPLYAGFKTVAGMMYCLASGKGKSPPMY